MDKHPSFRSLRIGLNDEGKRVDRILRVLLPNCTLANIYRMIRRGDIRLNRKKVPPTHRVREGDILSIPLSVWGEDSSPLISTIPSTSLPILYEDEDFLVLNKPKGVTAHGDHSLLPQIVQYLETRIPRSLTYTPGPLHRLDRNTTGVLVFGKSLQGARMFSSALRDRSIRKYYLTILTGILRKPALWEHRLQRDSHKRKTISGKGKRGELGITELFPIVHSTCLPSGATLTVLRIHTGMTHQIRAQASLEGHPLLGDVKYGGKTFPGGYFLHAHRLVLPGRLDLLAPLPDAFQRTLRALFGEEPLTVESIPLY
ncbi:MAG: 23S rRNA pseudouridine(955/2504/2580) synthase RluC [Spirochaetales bacterium]